MSEMSISTESLGSEISTNDASAEFHRISVAINESNRKSMRRTIWYAETRSGRSRSDFSRTTKFGFVVPVGEAPHFASWSERIRRLTELGHGIRLQGGKSFENWPRSDRAGRHTSGISRVKSFPRSSFISHGSTLGNVRLSWRGFSSRDSKFSRIKILVK
jgi:hypothetical protein